MVLRSTEKFVFFCSFSDFDIFLSTNFAENMNNTPPSNRILPHFEEVLVNAVSLQTYGDFLMDILRKKLCALKFRKMHTKSEKISKKNILSFLLIRMERNAHVTSNLVYCNVKCLFCFKLIVILKCHNKIVKHNNSEMN